MSINRKLIVMLSVALTAIAVMCIVTFLSFNSLADELDNISQEYLQNYRQLNEVSIKYHSLIAEKNQSTQSESNLSPQIILNNVITAIEVFKSANYTSETQQKASELVVEIKQFRVNSDQEKSVWLPFYTKVSKNLQAMLITQSEYIFNQLNELSDEALSSAVHNGLIGIIIFVFIAVTSVLLGRTVILPLRKMRKDILHTANNLDFSTDLPVRSNDEVSDITRAFNQLLNNLRESFNQIHASTKELIEVAEEVDNASRKIARNSKMQSDASTNMANAVEEMTNSISLVSQQSKAANEYTQNSRNIAEQSSGAILSTVSGIQKISETVREAASRIKALREDCDSISTAANIIHDIAGQTNLLALNAAIEAARAGEQGRGFAVVADEVRLLAARTENSTKEISELLSQMQDSARLAVDSMSATEIAVETGVVNARQAGDSIQAIREGSNAAVGEVNEISLTLKEQELASTKLVKHIDQIASMSEQNSYSASKSATSIGQMSVVTHSIAKSLSAYKTSTEKNLNIRLRVADILGDDFPSVKALNVMAKLLTERSNGRITIKIISGGDFGTEQEALEQTRSGVLDMARVNISQLNKTCPETVVPTLPFLFSSVEHMHRAMDGQPGRLVLNSVLQDGYIGLGLYDSGARSIYTKTPVRTVSDVRGCKFRVPPSDMWMAVADAMGAIATPMSIDEITQGIQMGLVDAAENNIFTYHGFEHYQSCPYFSKTEHVIAPDILVFSKKRWEKLSEQDKALITECALESVYASRTICKDMEHEAIDKVTRSGATIIEDVNKESFKNVMLPVYTFFVTAPLQKEVLRLIQQTK